MNVIMIGGLNWVCVLSGVCVWCTTVQAGRSICPVGLGPAPALALAPFPVHVLVLASSSSRPH